MENKSRVVSDILDYIDTNLKEDISVQDIAGTFYFNKHYLMKMFKRTTGITITQYVNCQKVIKSMQALANTDDRILKIALDNGYHSQEYYSEMFERLVGISPNYFRKNGYSPISFENEEMDMKETKLERIQRNIAELKKLREEVLGEVPSIEKEEVKDNALAPKVRILRRENQIQKVA